jgi:ribonuclease P protein component
VSKQFTLGKDERLKSRKQIVKLFAEGKSFVVNPFRIYFLIDKTPNIQYSIFNIQFGVGVSSKNFKRAVDRNRIKRLTREAWRLQKNDPTAIGLKELLKIQGKQLDVFFIYTGKELPDFKTMKDKVAVALKKLAGKIDENISPHS